MIPFTEFADCPENDRPLDRLQRRNVWNYLDNLMEIFRRVHVPNTFWEELLNAYIVSDEHRMFIIAGETETDRNKRLLKIMIKRSVGDFNKFLMRIGYFVDELYKEILRKLECQQGKSSHSSFQLCLLVMCLLVTYRSRAASLIPILIRLFKSGTRHYQQVCFQSYAVTIAVT
jgi:hypothetical protein